MFATRIFAFKTRATDRFVELVDLGYGSLKEEQTYWTIALHIFNVIHIDEYEGPEYILCYSYSYRAMEHLSTNEPQM